MFMRKTMRLLRNIEYLVRSIAKFMIDHGESSMVKIIAVNAGDMKIVEDGKKEYVAEDLVGHDVLIHEAPVNPLILTRESKEKADCEDDVDLESPYRFLETR